MSAGGIFILDTDTGPEDELLNGGEHMLPTQKQLRKELGLERLGMQGVSSMMYILILIFVVIVAMLVLNRVTEHTQRSLSEKK
jgi:hypothetical protein